MITGEDKKAPGGESDEPRSFAPSKDAGIGSIRQDIGEDPGDLSPDQGLAGDPGILHRGKNGRRFGDPMSGRR